LIFVWKGADAEELSVPLHDAARGTAITLGVKDPVNSAAVSLLVERWS